MTTGERFERAVGIMRRLREPGGCPWDREQDFDSITKYTVEETYEVLEAIAGRDWEELPGELGDLLLQVLFYAQMAREDGRFGIDEVLEALCEKLVRRHPHVFGEVDAADSEAVLANWEAIKREEREEKLKPAHKGLLDGVSKGLPATLECWKLSHKAAKVGFEWPELEGVFEKLSEETEELRRAVRAAEAEAIHSEAARAEVARTEALGKNPAAADSSASAERAKERVKDEVGDLLFTVVNLARYLDVDPELALRGTNRKFRRRFAAMEAALEAEGKKLGEATLEEMEAGWQSAKREE